jgi:SAM-dependent methyltransferase
VTGDAYDHADLYDLLHDDYRDDLPFYRALADDHGGPILELGAGSARVSVALARAGHQVVAVEPSAAMRARGATRLASGGAERVTWVDADMRTLALGVTYPLVIAPFNALMHLPTLADQDAALAHAALHVAPGGAFACDLFVPRFAAPAHVRVERAFAIPGADVLVWQQHDPVAQVIVTETRIDRCDAEGRLRRSGSRLVQRYFHRFELERALRGAGFTHVRTFGGFDRAPVSEASAVWAFVARR